MRPTGKNTDPQVFRIVLLTLLGKASLFIYLEYIIYYGKFKVRKE